MQVRDVDRARSASPGRMIHVVRNGRIDLEGATVTRGVMSITGRSVSTLLHFSGIDDINRIYLTAVHDGLGFRVANIGTDFRAPRSGPFDPTFMKTLCEYGRVTGLNGAACADLDPGAERAMTGGLAGAGTLVGSFSGNAGLGAAIGAGLGAGGGFVYDRHVRARDRAFKQGVQAGRTQR
jgi:hypothetical protein